MDEAAVSEYTVVPTLDWCEVAEVAARGRVTTAQPWLGHSLVRSRAASHRQRRKEEVTRRRESQPRTTARATCCVPHCLRRLVALDLASLETHSSKAPDLGLGCQTTQRSGGKFPFFHLSRPRLRSRLDAKPLASRLGQMSPQICGL
jgi:hypothetical protein